MESQYVSRGSFRYLKKFDMETIGFHWVVHTKSNSSFERTASFIKRQFFSRFVNIEEIPLNHVYKRSDLTQGVMPRLRWSWIMRIIIDMKVPQNSLKPVSRHIFTKKRNFGVAVQAPILFKFRLVH